jgi:hypothetical protein
LQIYFWRLEITEMTSAATTAADLALLMDAAKTGELNTVQALLAKGVPVNAQDSNAGECNALEIKADTCSWSGGEYIALYFAGTPLMWAAGTGKLDVVKCLVIEHKANVNALTKTGSNALTNAAFFGQREVVKYLMLHGTNIAYTLDYCHRRATEDSNATLRDKYAAAAQVIQNQEAAFNTAGIN